MSTTNANLLSCAAFAKASISSTSTPGFPNVSANSSFVLEFTCFAISLGSIVHGSIVASIPIRFKVEVNNVWVPPYRFERQIKLSPALHKVKIAKKFADCPEATPRAPTPPSKTASFFSKTSTVGLLILEYI